MQNVMVFLIVVQLTLKNIATPTISSTLEDAYGAIDSAPVAWNRMSTTLGKSALRTYVVGRDGCAFLLDI